jgi:hypothetical protein
MAPMPARLSSVLRLRAHPPNPSERPAQISAHASHDGGCLHHDRETWVPTDTEDGGVYGFMFDSVPALSAQRAGGEPRAGLPSEARLPGPSCTIGLLACDGTHPP